jgi:hypothetical protein
MVCEFDCGSSSQAILQTQRDEDIFIPRSGLQRMRKTAMDVESFPYGAEEGQED